MLTKAKVLDFKMKELKLIALYYYICDCYDNELKWHCQRFSNNISILDNLTKITDEEILTIYLYSMMEEEKYKIKSIHTYAKNYMSSWFPSLPSYPRFTIRLNRLSNVFPLLLKSFLEDAKGIFQDEIDFGLSVLDAMPIITCSAKRKGKVAREIVDKGYCSTKSLHYYGLKLHLIGFRRVGKIPFPEVIRLSGAAENDLNATREDIDTSKNRCFFADKAYSVVSNKAFVQKLRLNDVEILTPVKLVKGEPQNIRQFDKAANDLFSTAVSKVRQPVESFFAWLNRINDIQRASLVRSTKGLNVHVFGRITAAIAAWVIS